MDFQEKQRIIQEYVPGKQVTLAHVISKPDKELYHKLGVVGEYQDSIGVMTITPSEGAIIAADIASKSAVIELIFIDRFSGSLVFTGTVSDVEAALENIMDVLCKELNFIETRITKT